jgi:phosphohistidine phosphatase SixA
MFRIRSLLSCLLVALPVVAFSQVQAADAGWLESVRKGGYVIVVRHGLTTANTSNDPMANPAKAGDSMSNPAQKSSGERQLSEQGRAQAKSIGEAMHKLNIPVGVVMTSPLQRAVDTGTLLGYGATTTNPDLGEAGPALSPEENNRRAEAMRKLASQRPTEKNLVIVSHKPNILDAFGKDWSNVTEGETSVFEPDGKGGYNLVVRVKADEWAGVTQATH